MILTHLGAYTFCSCCQILQNLFREIKGTFPCQKVHEPSATAVKNQAHVQLQALNLLTTLMSVLQHNIENVTYEA